MKVTKIGHCCLVVEMGRAKIMIDPGAWTTGQNAVKDLTAVLITHEHPDHFHIESLTAVLANNPPAKVYANSAVGALLSQAGLAFELLEEGTIDAAGVPIEAVTHDHAVIYPTIANVLNTGFLIAKTLYYPGDAFLPPKRPVGILALPVAGPWMKLSEAVDFAKAVKPNIAFPVHDGFLAFPGPFHLMPGKLLPEFGVEFKPLSAGETIET